MQKKKLLTWMMCCLAGVSAAYAQNKQTALVVWMTDGAVESFYLSEKPEVTFMGQYLKIVSSKIEVNFPRRDIKEAYFDKIETGIKQVAMNEQRFVYQNDSEITLYGLTDADKPIRVYDANGQLSNADIRISGNFATISLSSLRKGVYIIKTSNRQSIKIIRK